VRVAWWVQLVLGAVCVAVGVALTLRPFTSLAVLVVFVAGSFVASGASELASMQRAPIIAVLAGLGWIAAGILVVAWAGITIHALAIVAGLSLLAGGLSRIAAAVRSSTENRVTDGLLGLATIVFGALALSWQDVTVLVIALLVGPRTVLFGIAQVARALGRRGPGAGRPEGGTRRWPRWLRVTGAVASLVLAAPRWWRSCL
jgi:uncharacterized membrane protein HdeD (DUF308 family)